jgi:hypothetical protein
MDRDSTNLPRTFGFYTYCGSGALSAVVANDGSLTDRNMGDSNSNTCSYIDSISGTDILTCSSGVSNVKCE